MATQQYYSSSIHPNRLPPPPPHPPSPLDASFVQVSSSIAVQQQQQQDERQQAFTFSYKQQQQQQQQQRLMTTKTSTSTVSNTTTAGVQHLPTTAVVDGVTKTVSSQQQKQQHHHHTNDNNHNKGTLKDSEEEGDDDDDDGEQLRHCIDFLTKHQCIHHSGLATAQSISNLPLTNLSNDSIGRIQKALEADIERLQLESVAYDKAILADQANQRLWNQAIDRMAYYTNTTTISSSTSTDNTVTDDDDDDDDTSNDNNSNSNHYNPQSTKDIVQTTKNTETSSLMKRSHAEDALRKEVSMLEESCRQCEHELSVLHSLKHEQENLHYELNIAYDVVAEKQNDLHINATAYDNELEQKHTILTALQDEYDRVTADCINLPGTIYNLQVDHQRGLRYPLINNLRLAYRPKNDVNWDEIQGAWSLAAQLLLSVGTLFDFQSKHCKIVPLSHCAKIIYYPPQTTTIATTIANYDAGKDGTQQQPQRQRQRSIVYNLGHPNTNAKRALLTWNALMCQLIHYVHGKMTDSVIYNSSTCTLSNGNSTSACTDKTVLFKVPVDITSTTIGSISLTKLDEKDDTGWSRAIHYMACNLLWLSDCASIYLRNEVLCG